MGCLNCKAVLCSAIHMSDEHLLYRPSIDRISVTSA